MNLGKLPPPSLKLTLTLTETLTGGQFALGTIVRTPIKSIHVGQNDLKHVGCLIRLSEEKQEFMKSLRLELLGDILKLPTNRKVGYGLLYKFKAILTLLGKDESICAGGL